MHLPEKFKEKYEKLLGSEAQAFLQTFDQPAVSGFRVNPLKQVQQKFANPIANMPWSYYGKISGKSLAHATGLVYSQEPAAQVVAQIAKAESGMRVLDLAAAPGGKSTHLLSYMNNQGILVSNEISRKRSKILVENMERFGARNALVTNETPERLANVFPAYFDLIVLDAPCSGEGMFRKDPEAMQYWSETYPTECARLQREILVEALKMLKAGGSLIYSTCTWAPEENEEVVKWLLKEYPYLELIPIAKFNGMQAGIDQPETARIYPHHFQGEGQFIAKLKDTRPSEKSVKIRSGKTNLSREQLSYWQDFAGKHLTISLSGLFQVFGDQLYLLPEGLPDLAKVKIARNGLHLGTFKTKRFEPSFALGMALKSDEVKKSIALDDEQALQYLSGHTISLTIDRPNGWYQVLAQGNGLGFAKWVNGTLKNYYPKGLRLK
ncbi:RsmF rRNA methyltransferase first C-terminal domain-containing protein [Streptococcus merionis]|uniref:tRNA and rRNA cytosine-C5-methylases n=1 Tax=Streptococcus merionis TaxID=400065 RepID=A0A239SP98_9STRE|nr:RsmB/NOP family class I SAM-dependent RNA methyltransferase [Streptococcus merionis]SNU87216.1 tRNA and rRNA cytosine-C5-methylases [Streptococcus merionis]